MSTTFVPNGSNFSFRETPIGEASVALAVATSIEFVVLVLGVYPASFPITTKREQEIQISSPAKILLLARKNGDIKSTNETKEDVGPSTGTSVDNDNHSHDDDDDCNNDKDNDREIVRF